MLITFHCRLCRSKLETEADAAGSHVTCPSCGASLTVPRKGLEPGTTVGGFRIQKLIGRGGMGEVYLAEQLSMKRPVALKILPQQHAVRPEVVARFVHEVRLQARMEHPNLVTAFEAGEDSGVLYLAMAYVKGESAHERIRRDGPLPEREALTIARKLAGALDYAWHEHRLLHRDVKPANVLLDARSEPKLADLGLAKSLRLSADPSLDGGVVGTPNYMSPEQAEGQERIDFRSDMYALGATLYTLLTGEIPFAGETVLTTLRRQATESLPDPRRFQPALSEPCVALLEIMLARRSRRRHRTWAGLVADIDRVLAGHAPQAPLPPPGESTLLRASSATMATPPSLLLKATALAVPIVVAIALVLAVALYLLRGGCSRPPAIPPPIAATPQAPAVTPAKPPTPATAGRPPLPTVEAVAFPRSEGTAQETIGAQGGAFREARAYARAHPEDFAGAIKRLERIRTAAAAGSPAADRATALVARLEKARQTAIAMKAAQLRRDTWRAVAAGNYQAALTRLEHDNGPLAAETASVRKDLAKIVRRRAAEHQAEQHTRQFEAALGPAIDALLRRDPAGARAALAAARPKAPPGAAKEADDVAALADDLAGFGARVLESFRPAIGRDETVAFRDGRTETLRIVSVGPTAVRAHRELPEGYVEIAFAASDLSPAEQWKRVGDDAFLRGVLAAAARNWSLAAEQFGAIEGRAGTLLAAAARDRAGAAAAATQGANPGASDGGKQPAPRGRP